MPQGKTRRKDDTWTTEDLTEALKGQKGDDKKKGSRGDDDKKERRRHRDDLNGDDSQRRHKDEDKKAARKKEEDTERERLRQERREKRGGEVKRKEERVKDNKPVDNEDLKQQHKRNESSRRHRQRDDDDGAMESRPHHGDSERKHHKEKESSRHRSREEEEHNKNDEDEADRRRQERREKREKEKRDEGSRRGREHRSKDKDKKEREESDRGKESHHKEKDRERGRGEREHEDLRDRDENRKRESDRPKETREEREERKQKEREERKQLERAREKEELRRIEEERKKKEEEEKHEGNADDYNDYEEDFEDYDDDFEDVDENEDMASNRKDGEMAEVLRALDAENSRLGAFSQHSNWSDSTELSDERFKEGNEERRAQSPHRESKANQQRSFINFISAKQRVLNQTQASKARQRANDLQKMIELDAVFYDLFDLPPVREYDLYIRSFGRTDTKQAYVQTNDDAIERDVQTEEIDELDKWTQHPADDSAGVGGEGISVMTVSADEKSSLNSPEVLTRMGKFLDKAAQMICIILEEERTTEAGSSQMRERSSAFGVCDGCTQLGCPSFLTGRYIEKAHFCPLQPNMFLTVHSKPAQPSETNVLDTYGLICVWNVREMVSPQKILLCLNQPTCACFSPSQAALVIAGMLDGSVSLWDLREPASLHRTVVMGDQEVLLRAPTYNTAGTLNLENHLSPVAAIVSVHSIIFGKENDSEAESLSFQFASIEEDGSVNLWLVTEIAVPDIAGSEVDLGLAPGGRLKLLRSSAVHLKDTNKAVREGLFLAQDLQLNPTDLNHFCVGTDLGFIVHGVRFGSRVFPRIYETEIESPRQVTCLDFSPFGEPYFLAGWEDGSIHLYYTNHKHPLATWQGFAGGQSVVTVQWSRSRPAVFFALAANSVLHSFDLVDTGLGPVRSDSIPAGRATVLALGSDPALIGGNKQLPAHMLIALDNGSAEIHTFKAEYREQQPLETEFLSRYMERF